MGESAKDKAVRIVAKMYDNDPFSQWLGIERLNIGAGSCTLQMTVREEMTNGFGVAHGGITFSLADSAFAFACNSHGRKAVSIECNINHIRPVHAGDILTASARQVSNTNRIGVFLVDITNQNNELVATFKGTNYRMSEEWEV